MESIEPTEIETYYEKKMDFASRLGTSRAYSELKKIVHQNEHCDLMVYANYKTDKGLIETGLLMLNTNRAVYVHRQKNQLPLIIEFRYADLSNVILDSGILGCSLKFIAPLYEVRFQNMVKSDAQKVEKYVGEQIRQCRQENQEGLAGSQELNQISALPLLDKLFSRNHGWTIDTTHVQISRYQDIDGITKYALQFGSIEIVIFEGKGHLSRLHTSNRFLQNTTIFAHHAFSDYEIDNLSPLLQEQFYKQMALAFGINKKNELVASVFLTVQKNSNIDDIRKQLLLNISILLAYVTELREGKNKAIVRKQITSTSVASPPTQSIQWSALFEFVENVMDVVDAASTIIDVVSGNDNSEENP